MNNIPRRRHDGVGRGKMAIIIGAIGVVLFLGLAASIPAMLIIERERESKGGEQ